MKLCRTHLCDGVSVNTVTTDRFKTAFLTVNLFVPLARETASAYSLLTDVLMRGTKEYPTMQALNQKQDELYSLGLGAYVQKKGEMQIVTFELTAIDDAFAFDGMKVLAEGMKLLSGLIFDPVTEQGVFKADYVSSEQKNLCDDIRGKINNKTSYARRRCIDIMCEGEPYAIDHGGDLEEVQAITPASLWNDYQNLLASGLVEIFYVGSKQDAEIVDLCKTYLPFAPRDASFTETTIGALPETSRTVTEQMRIQQCKLTIGFRTEYALQLGNFPAMALFNEVFGGSPNSKLFVNVREKKSLCYYCSSFPDGLKGLLMIVSGIEQKNKQTALDAIMEQLDEIKRGNVTDEELQNARRSLRNNYREITDSPASICAWYMGRICTGRSDTPEDAAGAIEAVTREDIVRVANSIRLDTVYYLEGAE